MTETSPYKTFYDEVLAHVPMDRWITHKEIKKNLNGRVPRHSIRRSLVRGKEEGLLLARPTGRTAGWDGPLDFPVHEYVRIVTVRPGAKVPNNARKKYKRRKPGQAKPKSTERKLYLPITTRLDPDKVRQIRLLRDQGATYRAIANAFDMYKGHVGKICRGDYWKHVR